MKRLVFSAHRIAYNEQEYFSIVCNARQLEELCRVSRADEDPNQGYQRLLSPQRVSKISNYFNSGRMIPGALILSASPGAEPRYDSKNETLSFLPVKGSFLIIDGQHRLFGAARSETEVFFPVCVFTGLEQREEVELFLDINGQQRGVPRALQLEIQKFVTDHEPDKIRLRLFSELNERDTSPLRDRMSRTRSVRGKISHVPFERAIKPLFEWQMFMNLDFEMKYKLIENYLIALRQTLPDKFQEAKNYKLANAAFFQASFMAFREIASATQLRFSNYKIDSFEEILEPLEDLDWERHSGTNKAAIKALSEEMVQLVSQEQHVTEDML